MIRSELSYWERESFFHSIDCLIIGSGIVGLSAAIRLKESDPMKDVVVVDRGPLPLGASTRNAGFACFGSLSELLDDLQHTPRAAVLQLVIQRYEGLKMLRQRYGDAAIGYEPLGGYEVFRPQDELLFEQCMDALADFNQDLSDLIAPSVYKKDDSLIARHGLKGIAHLIVNTAEGQLNTGRLMQTLLQKAQSLGVRLMNGIQIEQLEDVGAYVELQTTAGWGFRTASVLVATNGFARSLLPDLALQPARNQVFITQPIPNWPLKGSFHYDKGYVYFRNVGNRLLMGGGRNQDFSGETTVDMDAHEPIREYLLELAGNLFETTKPLEIDQWWSGIMGVGTVKQPIIQQISTNVVVAVRMGGMGVALGTHTGESAALLLI
ncbi:MAG: FAD-dependent oxidoreductase [Saprospiraceae bacterium]